MTLLRQQACQQLAQLQGATQVCTCVCVCVCVGGGGGGGWGGGDCYRAEWDGKHPVQLEPLAEHLHNAATLHYRGSACKKAQSIICVDTVYALVPKLTMRNVQCV